MENPLVMAVAAVAVLALVVVRQLRERPVGDRAFALPLVLTGVGLVTLVQAHPPLTATGVAIAAVELLVVAGFGVLRGRSVTLSVRDGVLVQRGGARTVVLWLLTIGVRIGLGVLAVALGAGALTQATLLLSLGASLAVQALVIQQRAAGWARIAG
jgi:hypothetical protein